MHRFLFMPCFILTGIYSKLYSNVTWVAMSVTVLAVRLWEWDMGWLGLFSRVSHLVPSAITASFALSCKLVYPPTGMANRTAGQQEIIISCTGERVCLRELRFMTSTNDRGG